MLTITQTCYYIFQYILIASGFSIVYCMYKLNIEYMFYSIYTFMFAFALMSTCNPIPTRHIKRRYSDYNESDSDSSSEFESVLPLPK